MSIYTSSIKSLPEGIFDCKDHEIYHKSWVKDCYGNVPLIQAKIIFIRDYHSILEDDYLSQFILEKLAHEKNIALFEAVESFEIIDTKQKIELEAINETVIAMGWDNMAIHAECMADITKLTTLNSQMQEVNKNNAQEKTFNYLLEYLIIKKALKTKLIDIRNQSLTDTILRVAKEFPDALIFVFAGSDHFTVNLLTQFSDNGYFYIDPNANEPNSKVVTNYINHGTFASLDLNKINAAAPIKESEPSLISKAIKAILG